MARAKAPVTVTADHREEASGVIAALRALPGVELEVAALPVGDFDLGTGFLIERKSAADFIGSIIDRRLFEQVKKLKEHAAQAALVLEGDIYAQRRIHANALIGAISYLVALEGIAVVPTSSQPGTAQMIATMARHHQQGLGYTISDRGMKPKTLSQRQRYLMEGLPGLGPERITALLAHFGSPGSVFAASVEELASVDGIGPKTAATIVELLQEKHIP